MTKTFQDETLFGFSNFGHWNLFDIWNLIFLISITIVTRGSTLHECVRLFLSL